jgi:hypothetical protein
MPSGQAGRQSAIRVQSGVATNIHGPAFSGLPTVKKSDVVAAIDGLGGADQAFGQYLVLALFRTAGQARKRLMLGGERK